jgi:RHS repeat-associated protein
VTTVYVYDAFGNLIVESSSTVGSTARGFYTTDHLESTRLITDSTGTVNQRYDYLPFGEEILAGLNGRSVKYPSGGYPNTADNQAIKFTGKERDAETGLDYFGARYLSAVQGRFTGPDVPLIDQYEEDPQSWNLYGYARNNPLRFVDHTGNACRVSSDGKEYDDDNSGQSCAQVREADKQTKPSVVVTAYNPGGLSPMAELILRSVYDRTAPLTQPSTYVEAAAISVTGGALFYGISAGMTAGAAITELGIAGAPALQRALDYALRINKLNHYFSEHHWARFEPLVEKLGGKEAVVRAVLEKIGNISGPGRFEKTIDVSGFQIVVKGYVGNGIVKLGDMWVSR